MPVYCSNIYNCLFLVSQMVFEFLKFAWCFGWCFRVKTWLYVLFKFGWCFWFGTLLLHNMLLCFRYDVCFWFRTLLFHNHYRFFRLLNFSEKYQVLHMSRASVTPKRSQTWSLIIRTRPEFINYWNGFYTSPPEN